MNYSLSLDRQVWTDITGLINSKKVSITQNLCTTEFKSAVDTASIELVPSANLTLWSSTLTLLMNEGTLYAKITNGTTTLFYGVVDKSKLTIETKRIPSSCSISLQDMSTVYLDKKPETFNAFRNKSISEIVTGILDDIDFAHTTIVIDKEDNVTLDAFIINPDDNDDYRTIIDDILFESGGYVLNTTEEGNAEIVKLKWKTDDSDTKRIIQSQTLSSVGVKTETSILDEDGLALTYYNLATTEKDKQGKQQAVYVGVTSLSKTDNGELEGDTIEKDYFYPADGDLSQGYIEYDESLLDKAYNVGLSRKSNDALAIVDVTDAELSVRAQAYDADGEEIRHAILDNSTAFSFPLMYNMTSNPTYYPNKAWVLMKNIYGKKINLLEFTIRGKVLYKSRKNNMLLPGTSKNPEEYEAKYIYTEDRAKNFANFYWHFKKYSRYVSTWKENSWGDLGELVVVNHKETEFAQTALVVSKTITFIRSDYPQASLTGVAVGEWNEYPVKVWGSSSNSRNPIASITTYYILESQGTKPESDDSRWTTTAQTVTSTNRYLWRKEIVTYLNETATEDIWLDVVYGEKGEDGSFLSLNVSQTQIDCYADGEPVSNEAITITAKSDLTITLFINNSAKKTASKELTYSDTPSNILGTKDSVVVMAKAGDGTMEQSYTISKVKRTGVLTITADKQSIAYYADDVPHDSAETVALTINAENYKTYPKLYLNGEEQTIEQSYSQTYTFKPSEKFGTSDTITAKVAIGTASQTVVISKLKDVGSLSISSSLTVFDYYADNVPVNTANSAVLTISQQGYSKMPKLHLNGAETAYSSGTYSISPTACQNVLSILAEVKNDYESKSVTITKVKQQPNIAVSASVGAVEYYYDGVNISDDIEVSVAYSGLFYAPLCRVGDKAITLDSSGKGTLPISWFDSAEGGLVVTAYAQKNIVCESSLNIPKNVYPLILQIKASSTQFSYDANSEVAPTSITIENGTTGLSNKNLVNLVVGGEAKSWTDGKFTVTPDMVTGRYLAISIGYGTESQSMLITKTYDGRWEEVEYAKTKSFTIYPGDDYTFVYNDDGLIYNGEEIVWATRWTKAQPDISSIEYLWRRARKDSSEEWQYTRLTGVKGTDGKSAGMYLGHYLEAPTTRSDGTAIENGDFYLNTSEEGAPLVYKYVSDFNQWQLVTTSDSNWSQIASDVMNDVNDYGGALLSTSAFYGFFQLLSAQKAFIKSLGAQEITLNDGGAIQSNNYETSGGAEGFKIDSDGRADFAEGTWRGSFANGLSFIPPTNLTVKKTMTHKEVYQAMKKAGIVEGVYRTAGMWDLQETGTYGSGKIGSDESVSGFLRTGQGFTCLDYDSLDMQEPLYTPFQGIIPIDATYMLGFRIITEDSTTTKTVYLFTKSMLTKWQWNASSYTESSDWTIYNYPLTGWGDKLVKMDTTYYSLYGTVVNGKLIVMNTETDVFELYHVDGTNMTLVKDSNLNLPTKCSLTRWLIPCFYYHKKGSYYETNVWDSTNNDYNNFKILKTTDFINYEVVKTITLNYTKNDYCIPMDIVYVNNRVFAQVKTGEDYPYALGFAEYNETTHQWDWIPDGYTQYMLYNDSVMRVCLPSLIVKNNVIYGTYSGHEFFSYDTNTNVYKDLSDIFRTCLLSTIPSHSIFGVRQYLADPPTYAKRIDPEVTKTTNGTLPASIGTTYRQPTISLDLSSAPNYIVCEGTGEWLCAYRDSSNSYQFERANGTSISGFKGTRYSISIPSDYQQYTLTFYALNNVSINETTYEETPKLTATGLIRNVDVTYTFTDSSNNVYTEHYVLKEAYHYSKYKEWDTLKITAMGWSDILDGIILTVNADNPILINNAYNPYTTLVYNPTTGASKSVGPLAYSFINAPIMLPLCQFAEANNEYLIVGGVVVYASSVTSSDKMSWTMNNVYLEDLLDYYNGNKTLENVMFPNPSSVPAVYKSMAQKWASAILQFILSKKIWEYDGKRLIRSDEETLNINCVLPYFNQNKMIIRETDSTYEIYLADAQWRDPLISPYCISFPGFWGSSYTMDMPLYYSAFMIALEISPNSNIYPILSIDKDSNETIGATFIWDFPAQLTTDEIIKTVVKADFFNVPKIMEHSNFGS